MSSSDYHFTVQTLNSWSQESLSAVKNKVAQIESSTNTTVHFISSTNAFKVQGSSYEKVDAAARKLLKIIQVLQRQEKFSQNARERAPTTSLYTFTGQRQQGTESASVYIQNREKPSSEHPEDTLSKSFQFHADIENPSNLLVPQSDVNYLEEISSSTKTVALLKDRTITVTGQRLECIEEALARFQHLENRALQASYQNTILSLVHYPYVEKRIKLFFFNYSPAGLHLGVPFTSKHALSSIYFLLPVVENQETGIWSGPDNIYSSALSKIIDWENALATRTIPRNDSRLAAMDVQTNSAPTVKIAWKDFANSDPMEVNECPVTTTLTTTPNHLDDNIERSDMNTNPTTSEPLQACQPTQDVQGKKNPEWSLPGKLLRDYNFNEIKMAFRKSLDHVRYFQGEVTLEARLGKIAYGNVTSDVLTKLWEPHELNEGMNIKPIFSNIVATEYSTIKHLLDQLGTGHSRQPYYIVEADARFSPSKSYSTVQLHINANMVNLEKVVTKKDHVLDINWNSLSRVYDFQLKIWTRKHLRHDIKPYTTFLKNISINPSDLKFVYRDDDRHIRVKQIKLKRKQFYRIDDHLTLELTLVTILSPFTSFSGRVEADPAQGKSYFTIRVSSHTLDSHMCHNISLRPGDIPPWSVDELVGGPSCHHLVRLIRTMIILTERAQEKPGGNKQAGSPQ
ncbi:hypothetical protein K493DRAFT_22761 [Basidiobolus meristosporus CBS 931.73]|uniref:DUF7905 domain-containing protein n=1 Tax=Basidiobolus meristosporus CBS 931.73 TaxID=1314790 RepID=A0A1Y1YCM8_9FUNG|nr:hypothetical protein K493DRAFT_22761 [Basidiobolus meristosporus CBS 931.73]|eukprot:ORX95749.1 hypothetical protein K493DRAFT_22761 [Basidiobolus meristosporus CBS 931.73]